MDRLAKYLILFVKLITIFDLVNSHTYTVKVSTDSHVNVIDSRFLSFTVDPKYLFSSTEKYNNKDSVCMASSLAPSFLRIAGPSTSNMVFHNATITFTDLTTPLPEDENSKKGKETSFFRKDKKFETSLEEVPSLKKNKRQTKVANYRKGRNLFSFKDKEDDKVEKVEELAVTHSQWKKFVDWAKTTGFDLVFALNNEEKNPTGLWDPNSALNIMTLAEKANFSDIYWQLGYECKNQSIDEYLYDLETLRAITESFDETREWRAVGGDVTQCLQADSKSDFRDFVTLTDDMMDAVVLNGNSSAQELQRMSEQDRMKLLRLLSASTTPLWLLDSPALYTELHRAADWMTSLGYSARNGFAVHFRELVEEELFEPTLGFYMALLFKNLVGDRVLNVDMDISEAVLFAHCTSLRHKPIPGAVTLYAANLHDETARFAVKLSRREDGGDILQFILGHDLNGNIIINGRAMYEGDIRPVVKRVRPYKSLLLNLPPRSFGFWVIANTKIDACQEIEEQEVPQEFAEAVPVTDDENAQGTVKNKRSMINFGSYESSEVHAELDKSIETIRREGLEERINHLQTSLNNVNNMFEANAKNVLTRRKRQLEEDDEELGKKKTKRLLKYRLKNSDDLKPRFDYLRKAFGLDSRFDGPKSSIHERVKKLAKFARGGKVNKRHTKYAKVESLEDESLENVISKESDNKLRRKRSVIHEKKNVSEKENISSDNDIDLDAEKEMKLWKILHKIHKQIKHLPMEDDEGKSDNYETRDEEKVGRRTRLQDPSEDSFNEETKHGLLKSTINNVASVLSDLNHNLNRFWNALTLLE